MESNTMGTKDEGLHTVQCLLASVTTVMNGAVAANSNT